MALSVLGAILLLIAASYWTVKSDGAHLHAKPGWWRALVALGWLSFILGIVWQWLGTCKSGR